MSKVLKWVRKSEGDDDDIGLNQQREELDTLAQTLGKDIIEVDLGVHTGFSRLSSDDLPLKNSFIDTNPDVQEALELIESGEIDYLVCWDDTRLARDDFFSVIEYKCMVGDCEIVYRADIPDDDMVNAVRRTVEYYVKLNEMKKAHSAKLKMQKEGRPDGRPPHGLQYSDDKTEFVQDPDEWDNVVKILRLDDEGEGQRSIARQVDPSRSVVRKVLENREMYEEFLMESTAD